MAQRKSSRKKKAPRKKRASKAATKKTEKKAPPAEEKKAPKILGAPREPEPAPAAPAPVNLGLQRRRMPKDRFGRTHKFCIDETEGYLTFNEYADGTLGEFFLRISKQGSTVSGFADSFAISCSLALQYGVPLAVLVGKFAHQRFIPDGITGNPNIPMAKSIVDYVFRYLAMRYLPKEDAIRVGVRFPEDEETDDPEQPQGG